MKRKWNGKKIFHRCVLFLTIIALLDLVFQENNKEQKKAQDGESWKTYLESCIGTAIQNTWIPAFSFANAAGGQNDLPQSILRQLFPVFAYEMGEMEIQPDSGNIYEKVMLQEGQKIVLDEEMAELLMEENQTGMNAAESGREMFIKNNGYSAFQKAIVKQQEYNWNYYQDHNALIKEFYAVDASTEADKELLNLEDLRGRDMTIQKDSQVPQILIYHTHSQETFSDSIAGDDGTTILGAGELLAKILREEYGYNVIHHTGKFDVESRDYAYSNSLPVIEKILEENPTIEVVIDLHRDEMLEGRKLVMDLNGCPTARLMFFNGLSHTKDLGDIEYLENPYIKDNLAFSFQLQVAANEYYPGFARKIYLKGYRYNMHLCPKSVLIELGAQTSTVEEIKNACAPIAHILDLVLSG